MKYILITLATATSLYTSDQRFATPRPRNQFEAIAVHNLQRKAQSKKPKVQSFPKKKEVYNKPYIPCYVPSCSIQ